MPFGRAVVRQKRKGRGDLEPLSVFLDAGVVPRAERADNYNQLGADLDGYLVVEPGDVVFNKLRTWQGGLGVSRHAGIVSPAYFVCRPNVAFEPRYLHYLLRSAPYLAEFTRISKFMPPSQFDITWEDLCSVPVPGPPVDEQRAIADFLDTETARIDALIAKKRRLIELLHEIALSHIDSLFEPLLGEKRIRLSRIARLQTGLTLDSAREIGSDYVDAPYLRVANVQPGRLDLAEVKEVSVSRATATRCRLAEGDVLMTEGGDLDKLGRGTVWRGELPYCLHQNHVFAVRPDVQHLLPEYLAVFTQTSYARGYFESTGTRSTNLASTNSSKVLDFRIPVVPVTEQRRRLDIHVRNEDLVNRCRERLAEQVDLLREHRQALITAAVAGELEVRGVAA